MSTKTTFKRVALAVVVALGVGMVGTPASQALVASNAVALSSATSSVTIGDTATNTITHTFSHTQDVAESATVRYSCVAPSGLTCPSVQGLQSFTADTVNVVIKDPASMNTWNDMSGNLFGSRVSGWTDSSNVIGNVRSVFSVKAVAFGAAGTYTYSFYSLSAPNGTAGTGTVMSSVVTWTVTVTGPNTTGTALSRFYLSSDVATANTNRRNLAPSSDSGIVASAGTAASPQAVGYAFITTANSAGDTRVAVGSGYVTVDESITVTVSGPGLVTSADAGSATPQKAATLNSRGGSSLSVTESLTIYSDGTAGTSTITFSNRAGTVLKTATVVFYGTAASASISLSDTYTYIGGTLNLVAQVKDAGGNLLTSGNFYVFSSDTKVVSAGASLYSNAATQYQTLGLCASATWSTTAKTLTCSLTTADTGTASIYLADSWNVTASSFVTTPLTLTVTGNTIASATVAFDKATYAPGERAVITITTKDIAGRVQATGATGTFSAQLMTPTLTGVTSLPYRGTSSSDATTSVSLTGYMDTGVETRVVLMPTYGTDVTYTLRVPGFGVGVLPTDVTASAKVVDPSQEAQTKAIAAAQAAAVAQAAAAQAAADAATDAALQAIDAANAATDAANLAAEAADAATVAAQESKDAADAATAAVESLATQVATLMAALQAQITSLANVVAKIAKKVKA